VVTARSRPSLSCSLAEAGPAAVDFAAFDGAAEDEHGVGVAVVGAAGAVLARGAAEFGHGDQGDVFGIVAHVAPEGGDGGGELAQAVGELAVDAALVLMGVPAADVGEGRFNAEVGLEQLGNLLHVVAEFVVGIFDAAAGLYWAGLASRSILTASKVSSPVAWKMLIAAFAVHGLKGAGRG
jgi:hypothetical protein